MRPADRVTVRYLAFRRLGLPPGVSLWLTRDSLHYSGPRFAVHLVALEEQMTLQWSDRPAVVDTRRRLDGEV